MRIQVKRIYAPVETGDGARVLVDRLWPRGVSKERATLTEWCKDVAPSTPLREWFAHDGARMQEFTRRYRQELATDPEKQAAVRQLLALAAAGPVTLLYAAKDPAVNHAVVLQDYLQQQRTAQ